MKTFTQKTPAKVNLTFEILQKRNDGFHDIRTTILKLNNLFDTLTVNIEEDKNYIKLSCNNPAVPLDEKNTCYKVTSLFKEKTKLNFGITIDIKKHIPIGAGLAGGSTNAAGLLKILQEAFNFNDYSLIQQIASQVGKDIPLFLVSEMLTYQEGLGEIIVDKKDLPSLPNILLVNPNIEIATPWAYQNVKPLVPFIGFERSNLSKKLFDTIEDNPANWQLYNDFEPLVFSTYPSIHQLKQALISFGANQALMTGSGSTVYGIFSDKRTLAIAEREISKVFPSFYCRGG